MRLKTGTHGHSVALLLGRALGNGHMPTTALLPPSGVRAVNKQATGAVQLLRPETLGSGTRANRPMVSPGSPSPGGPSGAQDSSQASLWPG